MYNHIRSVRGTQELNADVAQQVERVLGKDEVTGSNPVSSSIKPSNHGRFFFLSHYHEKTAPFFKEANFFILRIQRRGIRG